MHGADGSAVENGAGASDGAGPSRGGWAGAYEEHAQRPPNLKILPAKTHPQLTLLNYSRQPPSPTSSQHSAPLPSPRFESPTPSPTHAPPNWSRPNPALRSVSDMPYRAASDASHRRGPSLRPSEASRLRGFKSNHISSSARHGRQTPEMPPAANFSRPRKHSNRISDEPPRPVLVTANTFPRHNQEEPATSTSGLGSVRDRGISTSSSATASSTISPIPLRPSTSIPDYTQAESIYSRQRNISSRKPTHDSVASSTRRDLPPRSNGIYDDEVRTSFRSALTATSSFVGTSGTERSSVLTKSSSATSIFGREEGMSVDDAIGMYENGFNDSDAEGGYGSRPGTGLSHRSAQVRVPDPLADSLQQPTVPDTECLASSAVPGMVIPDPTQMFLDPQQNSTSDQNQVTTDALTPTQLQHPSTSHSNGGMSSIMSNSRPGTSRPVTGMTLDDSRDRYGFKKASQHITRAQYDAWSGPYSEHLARRRMKWTALMKECNLSSENPVIFPPKSTKVKRFIRKGIPPSWRGAAWFHYAGGATILAKHAGHFDELLRRAENGALNEDADEQIERDLHRTFPDNIRFKPDSVVTADPSRSSLRTLKEPETPILQSLRRVLQAFAVHAPKIGYCQSLNFLAGLLLLFMETSPAGAPTHEGEEKAFWMLVIITHVYLPGTHSLSLEGANVDLGVLMSSIKENMPQIWAKIGGELDGSSAADNKKNGSGASLSLRLPPITLCCTAWFMSCFIGTLPIETTLRVWDSFFYEGSKTVFRIAMAIFKVGEAEIRNVNDPMEIFQTVQTIPRRIIDANALLEACFRRRNGFGHLSQDVIEERRWERRQAYADERARARGETIGARGGIGLGLGRKATLFRRRRRPPLPEEEVPVAATGA